MLFPPRPRWWEHPTPKELTWFNNLDPRSKSEIFRWDINHKSHPSIRAGMDQCLDCAEFGHVRPCISTNPFPHAPPYGDWRRSINGKTYTKCKLRMTDAELAALATEEALEAPLNLSSDDLDLLRSIEEAAGCIPASNQSASSQPTTEATAPTKASQAPAEAPEAAFDTTQGTSQNENHPVYIDLTLDEEGAATAIQEHAISMPNHHVGIGRESYNIALAEFYLHHTFCHLLG
ncbi:uncharacterized protein MELLADRAFT_60062 [Melampsora larici-populina 98AG31]|uniref:Uncharacterized protein n=1 Tax=Melampsora larici-populina (strain 98AG31 / pathotype 3-4-7) TaxID=747676 RepID=F4R8L9_MELLP|nr:uncharacterized protein MELLADRAFT_60062 [Melampsora larici-populina 98AG31]EGG11041.1 hypothetical protein MELLADRAFT_60062 [Melampsora larici-populina 98AG31]